MTDFPFLRFRDDTGHNIDVRPAAVCAGDWCLLFGQKVPLPLVKDQVVYAAFPGGSERLVYVGETPVKKPVVKKKAARKKPAAKK